MENPMMTGRRFFLSGVVALVSGAAMLTGASAIPQSGQRRESPSRIPQIQDPAGTTGPDDTPLPPRADPKTRLKEEQKDLRRDVDRLLKMVQDLKDESDKTPETDVLSLSLVKKTEDIEKLARQIRDRIRAS